MDAKEFSSYLEHRMTLKERLAFKIAKRGLREDCKDQLLQQESLVDVNQLMAEGEKGFYFGGFVLGLLLGLIGVLIAYLTKREKAFIRSAWVGWGVWLAILVAILAAAGASA